MRQLSAMNRQSSIRSACNGARPRGGKSRRRLAAFTLIELLVVIAILIILAALLLPALAKAKEKSKTVNCLSNLKQLEVCWHLYAVDHLDKLPPNNSIMFAGGPSA